MKNIKLKKPTNYGDLSRLGIVKAYIT